MQRSNNTSSTELFPARSQMRSWLMGIPQLHVSISHVATFLRSIWNVLDKAWRKQAAGLCSFKDRFDQIWVTLSHDFTWVSKHSLTVHSELRGAEATDVADDFQSWVSSLHCYVLKGLYSVSSVSLIFIVRKKNSFIFFSLFSLASLISLVSKPYSCKTLTWCHPDSNWESKNMQTYWPDWTCGQSGICVMLF